MIIRNKSWSLLGSVLNINEFLLRFSDDFGGIKVSQFAQIRVILEATFGN